VTKARFVLAECSTVVERVLLGADAFAVWLEVPSGPFALSAS
jgi:hypothetical protein